jgi:hypothetical protein
MYNFDGLRAEEGIVYALDFTGAVRQLDNRYKLEQICYLAPIGEYLDREVLNDIPWRTDNKYVVSDDCDSCKI